MATCRYPKCRSKDIQLTYLGKPLCTKHWVKISEMPLEKAKKILNLPFTVKPKSPKPVETRPQPPDKIKYTTEPAKQPPAEIDELQMNIFGEQEADQDTESGQVRALRSNKSKGTKAGGKRARSSPRTTGHPAVQQNLFGDAKEEAS